MSHWVDRVVGSVTWSQETQCERTDGNAIDSLTSGCASKTETGVLPGESTVRLLGSPRGSRESSVEKFFANSETSDDISSVPPLSL